MRREGPALLFLTAAAALFFWPLWVAGYRFPKGSGDLWGAWYPVWSFVAESLRQGIFPLWNYRMMGGDPIFSDIQYGLLNPLNWSLFLTFPIPHELVFLRGAFPLWWAGVGMYLYLRYSPVWHRKRMAALTDAVAYMFRPEEVAVVQNGPQLDGTGQGRIEVGYYEPNRMAFFVETDAPALLVLSDTFYPGWQARVDGQPMPIYQTDAALRGVLVPPGRHRVEMHFRPQSLMVGLGMAVAGGLGCLALWLMRRQH